MHKNYLFGAIGILLSYVNAPTDYGGVNLKIEASEIGPYEKFQNDTQISFKYSLGAIRNNVYEEIRVYNAQTNRSYYKITKATHSVGKSQTITVNFDLRLKKYFDQNGFKINFAIYADGETVFNQYYVIYPIEKAEYSITNDSIKRVTSKTVGVSFDEKGYFEFIDDFNFVNTRDYIDADNYYSLNLNDLDFLYNQYSLIYESAYLKFRDSNNNFKFLDHKDGNITLPLKIVDDKGIKHFEFKDIFYVDKLNLNISTKYQTGFVKSQKFYFPVNKKEDYLGTDFEIVVNNCGFSKFTFKFNVTYDAFRELLGSCNSSDYCVRGEIE